MPGERAKGWQGSKWIWPVTRLAIYHRDGFRCAWCLRHVREIGLCLDHIIRVADGGNNSPVNLVTACFLCNRDRDNLPPVEWARFLVCFWGRDEGCVAKAVRRARDEKLDRVWARAVQRDNPSWLRAMRARSSTAWQAENPPSDLGWPDCDERLGLQERSDVTCPE